MLEQFLHHIKKEQLISLSDKVLLAVSGGIDSMVMLELFHQASWEVAVVHCNFQLRGHDSTLDEDFVGAQCAERNIPCYVKKFTPKTFAKENGISLQMAARELRYTWFDEMLGKLGCKCLATAHHLNDSFETTLLNLIRGTGIDGVQGIAVKHEDCIRPLLFATRDQIHAFALENNLTWREDVTNLTDHYSRNFLRHQVIPLLRDLNPNLEGTWVQTQARLRGGKHFAKEFVNQFISKAVRLTERGLTINREMLQVIDFNDVLLWDIIKSFGFNYDQCCDVMATDHQSGKIFYSASFSLIIDRDLLQITSTNKTEAFEFLIDSIHVSPSFNRTTLSFHLEETSHYAIRKTPSLAELDYDTLVFPLRWRSWREGDRFVPLGMKQHKKVSDFLIDEKVSIDKKDDVSVLESGDEIVWIVGMRIADPFKVTAKTKCVLQIGTNV